MQDFWETHHWPEGERRAHWHLLFEDQPAVHDFARAHAGLLTQHPQLTPVPTEWLHATLQSIGPLTPGQADAVAEAARPALAGLQPFGLEIGPAQAIYNGVVTAIYPEDRISELFWALRQATESAIGTDLIPKPPARYWPHMSLAYSNAHWNADELARSLVKVRPSRARITVTRAVLVDQQQIWRDRYTWIPLAEVSLGHGTHGQPVRMDVAPGEAGC